VNAPTDRTQDTEAIRAALNRSSGPRVLEADAALGRLVARLEAAEQERKPADEHGLWSGADPRIVTLRRERDEAHTGYLREIDAISERYERRVERLREQLERIADNAESWHGYLPPDNAPGAGHVRALAVIATWARAALAAAAPGETTVTHGRHCPCSACAREDWTRITGPCGMHGADCPAVYAPAAPGETEQTP
jgi:hypothetical protein